MHTQAQEHKWWLQAADESKSLWIHPKWMDWIGWFGSWLVDSFIHSFIERASLMNRNRRPIS